jgi:AcrR family transcriptional regulator
MPQATAFAPPRLGPASPSRRAEQLLDELEETFLAEGFHHLSIAELATRLRTSRRTFYELAPSRDELVLVVLDRIFQRMGRQAHDALAEIDDPLDRVEAYLSTALPELRRMTARFNADLDRQPAARRLYADHVRYGVAVVGDLVQEAIEIGRAHNFDPYFVSQMLNAMIDRVHAPEYRIASQLSLDESLREIVRFFRAALEIPMKSRRRRPVLEGSR